ncbi:zinc finger-containing protein [Heterostelium album PN500]|uniref:E3 ubiquitin-protein ligase n=1 Tax=Heterostelium pallidum (strain ATCC 26659 / Pp 5 / PN500) TaxID=670386 RepID=D3B1Y3_HETP5|nr:zinc finger-containing protein [Heterostelium album PN500]EFA85307.1 zinc finger-containing protein [Heterostelium album PN500]|eukprot:XP_020437416.1 zinc finger-containing protein [Heterostelium album PN500]
MDRLEPNDEGHEEYQVGEEDEVGGDYMTNLFSNLSRLIQDAADSLDPNVMADALSFDDHQQKFINSYQYFLGALLGNSAVTTPKLGVPEYGADEFTFGAYTEALKKITSKSDISSLIQEFLNIKESLLELVGTELYKFPYCKYEWDNGGVYVRCLNCEENALGCICVDCFKKGEHTDHEIIIENSSQGGCCDCGNPDIWKTSGFCSDHFLHDKPTYPPKLLEPEVRKRLHLFVRFLIDFTLSEIQAQEDITISESEKMDKKERLAVIIQWIEEVSTQSYPLSHILSEEFTLQTLDATCFDLHKPQPLPFQTTGDTELDTKLMPPISSKSPILILLQYIKLRPLFLSQVKVLFLSLMGNPLFKIVMCDEFLKYYSKLEPNIAAISVGLSYLTCQMYEVPSIVVPFATGYSKSNIIITILTQIQSCFEHRFTYDLSNRSERLSFEEFMSKFTDSQYLTRYFRHQQVTEYAYNNDFIINKFLSLLGDIQGFIPITRALDVALPFELPIMGSSISIESDMLDALNKFFEKLKQLKLNPTKYISLILDHMNFSNKKYFTFNNYELPSNDIFNGVDTVSIHSPLNRLIGILILSMINGSDYNQSEIKSLINNKQLLSIVSESLLPIVLVSQFQNRYWQKNLNVEEFKSFHLWSFLQNDLFNIQYSSILLGPNYFLNVLISTFTSNYKSTKEYPHCLNDLLTLVIRVLQFRKSSMHSYEEVRYSIIQSLFDSVEYHSKLVINRRDFYSRHLESDVEKAIQEVSTVSGASKKHSLKPEYFDRYDYYYPYHLRSTPESTLEKYHEYQKSEYSTFPLPCKLDALHPNLSAVNQLFDEPLIYQIAFSTLLSFVHPSYQMKVKFESLSNFKDSEYFIPSPTNNQSELDQAANHILYLLSMAMRNFKESTMNTLRYDEVSNIRSTFKSYLLNENNNNNQQMEKPISILNIVQPYQVIVDSTSNTIKPISIFDLVTDLFEIIECKHKFISKKNLICNLLISVNEFDSSVNQYFTNRKMSIDEVINIETEKEERIKKEESLKRQMMIKEKMMQQQLQFLQNNDQFDNEESSNADTEANAIVCLSCKSSRNSSSDPLCAIGGVEGSHTGSLSKRQTILKHYPAVPLEVEKEYTDTGAIYYTSTTDPQNVDEKLFLSQLGYPLNVRCCDHYVHKSCIDSFVTPGTFFKCPLCNRVSCILLPIDNQSRNKDIQKDCMEIIIVCDTVFRSEPDITEKHVQQFLWKYPLTLIESIEVTSRLIDYYNEEYDVPYYVFSETEFQRRLKTLRLLYFNIKTFVDLENTGPFDLWGDSSADYDPFILATYNHYLNNNDSSDSKLQIRKAYERLIFIVFSNAIKRLITPSGRMTDKQGDDWYKGNMESFIKFIEDSDGDQKETYAKVANTLDEALTPFLRKSLLFKHCVTTNFEKPLNIDQHQVPITLETFSSVEFLLKSLELPNWREVLPNFLYQDKNFSKFKYHFLSFSLPPVTPKFIDLPQKYVDFFVKHVESTVNANTPKGICLFCGNSVKYDKEKETAMVLHTTICSHGIGLYLHVTESTLTVHSSIENKIVEQSNLYFNKFGEASTRIKDNLELRKSFLKQLYIAWLKGSISEKY